MKRKCIKTSKEWTPKDPTTKAERWAARARELERVGRTSFDIVYVDEVMFTKHTQETSTWAAKG